MKVLLGKELLELIERPPEPGASLYMPSQHTGDTLEGPARLKNLIRRAEQQLVDAGVRAAVVSQVLAPGRALAGNAELWKQPGDGLALFLSASMFRYYRAPYRFPEMVLVSDRFHVTPLVQLFSADRLYYVLALSQNKVRLVQCTRDSVRVVTPEQVPASLAEHLRYDAPERQATYHAGGTRGPVGRGGVIFHGVASGTNWDKDNIQRFFTSVDRGLRELLHAEQAPLVIAGVPYLHPLYRQANTYPHLLADGIEGNPDDMTPRDLQQKGWPKAAAYFDEDRKSALSMYVRRSGSGQTTNDLERIVAEAHDGHVFKLFLSPDLQKWGRFNRDDRSLVVHERRQPGDDDLVDLATVRTLASGGSAYAIAPGDVPGRSSIAAVLRFSEVPVTAT